MSPKKADPDVRTALIEQAAHMLAEEGSTALTLRRLTRSVGVSTMAVYTHFGSMEDLRRAVREEGFARLRARMETVAETDDPVADLAVLGWAYLDNALANPHLYMAMFGEVRAVVPNQPIGLDTFASLVAAVGRCIEARRFHQADPVKLATQLWVAGHGVAMMAIAGLMTEADSGAYLREMSVNLMKSFAVAPETVDQSVELGLTRVARRAGVGSGDLLPDR